MAELSVKKAGTRTRKRVVIVGAGFAGMHAARALNGEDVDVILVDSRNYHLFQPLLYQVALAVLSPGDIAQPIRGVVGASENVQVVMDEVTGIDVQKQEVRLKTGIILPFDYLCLATGSSHSYFGHDKDWAPLAPGLKTIENATEIRRRILLAFELAERQSVETGSHPPLNFVVVGGGPTGVELAGAIADISRSSIRKEYRHINSEKITVELYEGLPKILAAYPDDLAASAKKQLEDLGVQVHTGTRVEDVKAGYLVVNGKRINAVVSLWAAGVQASALGGMLNAPLDKKGCVLVDDFLNPAGLPHIFVLGDLAHFEQDGKQVPGVAQPAMQMGDHAAQMILADVRGESRKKFRYFDKGDMATIGRHAAVAKVLWPFKAHLSGYLAWLIWAFVHIAFLIGFRNRLAVMLEWAWAYVFFRNSVRLITGDTTLVGWQDNQDRAQD